MLIFQYNSNYYCTKLLSISKVISFLIIFPTLDSCKKFVEIDPPRTQLVSSSVFASDATANATISGIYSSMMSSNGYAGGDLFSITFLSWLSADEYINYYGETRQYYTNTIASTDQTLLSSWSEPYQYIFGANAIIEGLLQSTGVSAKVKTQLEGEAKFIRAFCYFYLVNEFGEVPLHTATDYKVNNTTAKATVTEIYAQIIKDLKEAQHLLSADYSFSNGERVRPNSWAATALLARSYLFIRDWANAEIQSSAIINASLFSLEPDLNRVFLKNSSEAIWQLLPVLDGYNTNEGKNFIISGSPSTAPTLSNFQMQAFETGDARKANWIGIFNDGTRRLFLQIHPSNAGRRECTNYYRWTTLRRQIG